MRLTVVDVRRMQEASVRRGQVDVGQVRAERSAGVMQIFSDERLVYCWCKLMSH